MHMLIGFSFTNHCKIHATFAGNKILDILNCQYLQTKAKKQPCTQEKKGNIKRTTTKKGRKKRKKGKKMEIVN